MATRWPSRPPLPAPFPAPHHFTRQLKMQKTVGAYKMKKEKKQGRESNGEFVSVLAGRVSFHMIS